MQIRISGKQIEIGTAFPEAVRTRLGEAVGKYFNGGSWANVVFSHEGAFYRTDVSLHLDAGTVMTADGEGAEIQRSFDVALERLETQIRRYMRKLKNHHA